ncbi:hypothetical protein [Tranquillimonas alkanivorans]|uniref:Flagellar FliJ protein n=1 Tax=Tranquillimonas alkanivorans TaxID=441119 RepID=A0A1I5S635_9RHOB|nr:hypothetical protein [Tranquillimonas alkanivorans]SFP66127.1 hypothetical protein SAMN04488047_11060 [Tranquillimonas alkanivorans]
MSESRRIRALDVLERLRRHEMEVEARELGLLRGRIAEQARHRDTLKARLVDETHGLTLEGAPYLADFLRSMRAEIAAAEQEIAKLEQEAERYEDAVRERYAELHSVSAVLSSTRARAARDRDRREAQRMEEQVLLRWDR